MPHIRNYKGKRAHMIGIGGSSMSGLAGMLKKAGVIVTPGSSFGSLGKGYVRFALVQPPERLAEIVGVIRDSGVLKQ